MPWEHLLSDDRPHGLKKKIVEIQRTPFERDFDRIVFSSAFRRLQDKTQVHPIPNTDYVRRRLTHSLEVSCVARSLGTFIGKQICRRYRQSLKKAISPSSFGQITAAAALAHDIGNPPFGHIGETAIAEWFKQNGSNKLVAQLSEKEVLDFTNFEGNAQGFRILSRIGNNNVGLKLTTATLAAFTKYPTSSIARDSKYVGHKKFGFFCDDFDLFRSVAKNAKLIQTSPVSGSVIH